MLSTAAWPLGCSSLYLVPQKSLHTWCGPVPSLMEKAPAGVSAPPLFQVDTVTQSYTSASQTQLVIIPELCHHTGSLCLLVPLTTDGHPQKGIWGRKMCSIPPIMEDHKSHQKYKKQLGITSNKARFLS